MLSRLVLMKRRPGRETEPSLLVCVAPGREDCVADGEQVLKNFLSDQGGKYLDAGVYAHGNLVHIVVLRGLSHDIYRRFA